MSILVPVDLQWTGFVVNIFSVLEPETDSINNKSRGSEGINSVPNVLNYCSTYDKITPSTWLPRHTG